MIGYLEGTLLDKDLHRAIVNVQGVGYVVHMPITDLSRFGALGTKVKAFIHTRVREDAIELFGFENQEGLSLFEKFVGVNGVGPRIALAILSGMEPERLVSVVSSGDEAALCKVPGIGKKTAARIILELKDKFLKEGISKGSPAPVGSVLDDLESALGNLGYRSVQIERAKKAVGKMVAEGASLEALVKEALRHV